jgi:hypothetical protein
MFPKDRGPKPLRHRVTINKRRSAEATLIRLFCFCLATYPSAFVPIEGSNSALAAELPVGPMSRLSLVQDVGYRRPHGGRAYPHLPRYHYYGAERPSGYYGYGYYQPYRPYAY